MISIDKLCYTSHLRYVNGAEKTAYAILTLSVCIASRSLLIALIVLLANAYLNIKKGGISWIRYIKLMTVPLAFLFLSTIVIIVNISSVPMDAFAFRIGARYLTGSARSIMHGLQLILTALASVSCLYFWSLNTTMTDILAVFRRLHCPKLIAELMLLIYRFIFVLNDIASAITISQHARLGNKDFRTSVKSLGLLGSSLFILSVKQSGELYDALESRCYQGDLRVLSEYQKINIQNLIYTALFECLLILILFWENFYL